MMWKENYRLGVDLIDSQHQQLFERVSSFMQALRAPVPWTEKLDEIKNTLSFMQEYVVTHFRDEEAYQAEIGYPDHQRHRVIHAQFTREVTEFAQKFAQDENDEKLVQQFAGKLLAWLINHVASCDRKIAEYVQSRGGTIHD